MCKAAGTGALEFQTQIQDNRLALVVVLPMAPERYVE